MKRRSSLRVSSSSPTKHRHIQLLGSPSSTMVRTGQDCLDLNDAAEVSHVQDEIVNDRKAATQSTRVYRRRGVLEGSRNHGKTVAGFDLNTVPDEHSDLDSVPLDMRTELADQGNSSQEDDAHGTVVDLPQEVEVIDVDDGADQEVNLISSAERSAIQWANEMIVVEAIVDQPVPSVIDVEENVSRPTSELIDVELPDNYITLLAPQIGLTQVQNQHVEVASNVIVLDEEVPGEELSSWLTLAVYPQPKTVNDGTLKNNQIAMDDQPQCVVASPEPQNKEPKEPSFTCPICWGPFVEECSTICGHIFCQACIIASIKVQKKCPTCRKKLNKRNIHRVYLPTTL